MRNLILVLSCLLFTAASVYAQSPVPNGFSYQAVVRDSKGLLKKGASVELRFSLLPGQNATTPTYVETHVARTDSFGVCAVVIGQGAKTGGTAASFGAVDFGVANFWINIELKDGANWALISKQQLLSVPYAQVARRVVQDVSPIPAGTIMAFGGDTTKIPQGWLLCDGKPMSRSTYSKLFETIGTNWGRGNNSTTFHLPDLRGRFLRGVDGGAGNDQDKAARVAINEGGNIGNAVGSVQVDELKSHTHAIKRRNHGDWYDAVASTRDEPNDYQGESRTEATGGSETRPKNAYVYYIIKY